MSVHFLELMAVAVALSMDAFAVSICKGLSLRGNSFRAALTTGLYFGVFQAIMPTLGYFLGETFESYVVAWDHWIAFILLGVLGARMAMQALKQQAPDALADSLRPQEMLPLALATSIDAMAAGITFAFLRVEILGAASLIGCCTFLISMAGVYIGRLTGSKFERAAQLIGGLVLVGMGCKILLEHLGVFA